MVSISNAQPELIESLVKALIEEIYQDGRLDEHEQEIMQRVKKFLVISSETLEQIRSKTLSNLSLDEYSGTFDKKKFFHKITPLLLKHYNREEVAHILLEFADCLQIDSAQTNDRGGVQNQRLKIHYQKARDLLKSGKFSEGIQNLEKIARLGNPEAQYTLGSLYMQGKIIKKNHELARTWFQMAADNGHTASQGNLGIIFLKGMGVSKNLEMAFQYALSAARKGYSKSQFQVARSYFKGVGVPIDLKEAETWFIKAANAGENIYQELAELYTNSMLPGGQQTEKAIGILSRGLKLGHFDCAPNLALLMLEDESNDPNNAISLLEKISARGHAASALCLGNIYSQGISIQQDWNLALQWYTKSAKLGSSEAFMQLGLYFQPEVGPGENSRLAALFFTLAYNANQSLSEALLYISEYETQQFSETELAAWAKLEELKH